MMCFFCLAHTNYTSAIFRCAESPSSVRPARVHLPPGKAGSTLGLRRKYCTFPRNCGACMRNAGDGVPYGQTALRAGGAPGSSRPTIWRFLKIYQPYGIVQNPTAMPGASPRPTLLRRTFSLCLNRYLIAFALKITAKCLTGYTSA